MTAHTHDPPNWRDEEPQKMRIEDWTDRRVLTILLAVAALSAVFSAFMNMEQLSGQWVSDFAQNFSTEMFGAFLTFFLLEKLVGTRSRKEEIIRKIKSRDASNSEVDEARELGYLLDGTFADTNLVDANLEGTTLHNANLAGVDLQSANLAGAKLYNANLEGVQLGSAYLAGADLRSANLAGANLHNANLEDVQLGSAYLAGATLLGAKFNEKITLPDGTKWTPDTDLTRFTNPEHLKFRQPYWVKKQ